MCQSLDAIDTLYRGLFRGIISDRGGAGVLTSGVLVGRSDKLLLLIKTLFNQPLKLQKSYCYLNISCRFLNLHRYAVQ